MNDHPIIATGGGVLGTGTMIMVFGVWGLVISVVLILGLAVLRHLPAITHLVTSVSNLRERRRVLDDPDRTNRYIAVQTATPLTTRKLPTTDQSELWRRPGACPAPEQVPRRRPRPYADP